MYQLADKLSFIYSDAQCGYVGIGRQAWLRAKWGIPVRVRVSLAAPYLNPFGLKYFNSSFTTQ